MPFKSKAQRRWMYENMPETAKRWEVETPSPEALPNRIHKKRPTKKMSNRRR